MAPVHASPARTRLAFLAALVAVLPGLLLAGKPSPATAAAPGEGLELVAEVPIDNGSHLELTTIKGRDYAFVSELGDQKALKVIDVTVPSKARVVATTRCNGFQGNVQVSHDRKTLVIGFDDGLTGGPGDGALCPVPGNTGEGFVTIDITNPKNPRPLGFAHSERGSHAVATHPTKPFVYSAEGFPEAKGQMEAWSIENPAKPKLVDTLDTGAHSPHDLAFNADGTMAATANVVNIHLLDTTNPAAPEIVHTTQCPGCLHTHEARFTPDGKRLVVNDEYPAPTACPGGAMYFYDIAGGASPTLELSGAYTIGEKGQNAGGETPLLCTPHVFDISADGNHVAASWHQGGVRYLDISETAGVTAGKEQVVAGGVKEVGWYSSPGTDAFAAKMHKGPYVYVVDANIGFQVFRVTAR